MHSYLAWATGSQNESLMSVIEYKGNPSEDASLLCWLSAKA